jgi:hypothetical protein
MRALTAEKAKVMEDSSRLWPSLRARTRRREEASEMDEAEEGVAREARKMLREVEAS